MSSVFKKDQDSVLDYSFDWTAWLFDINDTIASVSWAPDTGLTVSSSSHTDATATAFVSGGAVGDVLKLTCRIVTTGGRTDDRTITLKIVNR